MNPPSIKPLRKADQGHRAAAVVFIHGFTGSGETTWMNLAPRIANEAKLSSWDFWTLTYSSSWLPDMSGIWSADADLGILAQRLSTDLEYGGLAHYKTVALIAHSMGGLIVQKTLVDSQKIAAKTDTVVLFGTPSGGLKKAGFVSIWKSQLADMARDGSFIARLREDWKTRFETRSPFSFLAVGGEKDQFVPPESSLKPFPKSQQAVVAGNHVTMLAPPETDSNVVDLVTRRICGERGGGDIGDSALRAIERGEFNRIVRDYLDKAPELDRKMLIRLAIALDALGRRDEAYEVLAKGSDLDSDALGVMAGRLKRKWLQSGRRRVDAEAAMAHYAKGYDLARARDDENGLRQAYYHGINLAFLALVFQDDRKAAIERATAVLEICKRCEVAGWGDVWLQATQGEANLILRRKQEAFDAYRQYVAGVGEPWELSSTYLNARTIAKEFNDRNLALELGKVFGDSDP